MTGSTNPTPPQQPQQQQQQPGPSGTGAETGAGTGTGARAGTGAGTGTGTGAGAVTRPPALPSIQIPPPDPQAQHAQQQQPPSPVGYGAYPPAPPSPGGYPQAPPSPGGYPQAPPSPGGYPQAPSSPGYQQVAPNIYGTPIPYQQPYYQQPMYYGQLPPQPYVQQPYALQGQPLQQPGQPPLQPYTPSGQPLQQQPGQPPQQPDQQERGQLPQQPHAPQGQPLQQLSGQPPPQPYVPQGQPLQQLPGQLPQQGQYPQAPYSPQYAYPPPQAPYYPTPQGFPQQQPGYAPYGQQFPVDPNHPLTGPHQPLQSGKPKQYSSGYTFGQIAVGYDPSTDATVIKKALSKDNHVDLNALLKILPTLTPLQIESLKGRIYEHSPQELTTNATGTEDTVKLGIHGLLYGPRDFDAFMVHRAISDKVKFGTSFKYTWMLSLALLGRKDGDIEAIKDSYKRMFGDTLLPFLKEALKKETLLANLFMNALENHSFPGLSEVPEANKKALEDEINKEADDLFTATVGNVEGNKFAWVFTTSSRERLKDIMAAFNTRHKQSLVSVVEKKLKKTEAFRDELLYILRGVENRPKRDAELLENTMKGIGTRDTQLTFRLITASWDKEHLTKVKNAYKKRFPTRGSLLLRIEGDTSGEHQKFLKALVDSDAKK